MEDAKSKIFNYDTMILGGAALQFGAANANCYVILYF